MVEITFYQAVGSAIFIFSLGVALGYKIGSINKTVTTVKTQCNKSMRGSIGISIEKIYINGKCKDVNCMKLEADKICTATGVKCMFL